MSVDFCRTGARFFLPDSINRTATAEGRPWPALRPGLVPLPRRKGASLAPCWPTSRSMAYLVAFTWQKRPGHETTAGHGRKKALAGGEAWACAVALPEGGSLVAFTW